MGALHIKSSTSWISLQLLLEPSVPPLLCATERTGRNQKPLIPEREGPGEKKGAAGDTNIRVNEGLDPVTCRVIRRCMMGCVDGLQLLRYCSALALEKKQLNDSLTDISIERSGQLII